MGMETIESVEARERAIDKAMEEVAGELDSAMSSWPPFNSAHEGYAVLLEECTELWEHVRTNQKRRDLTAMRTEALQVAAMAIRFVVEVTDERRGRK
jgi:NTP pyrophosphatase (non-canonical NTP hydrolase)